METNKKTLYPLVQMPSITETKQREELVEKLPADPGQWKVISAYSRKQAIDDGVLVDVSEMAKEAGFRYPVALTRVAYDLCVKVPIGVIGQDEKGRLWDVLFLCAYKARFSKDTSKFIFPIYVRNNNVVAKAVTLKAVCGANDDASPCLTVMLETED